MPWIVMELIKARPLDQVIAEDGPLPPAQAAQLGLSLLDALSTAHAAGVLHRDVKPSNVLISPEGKAILTDFGIATVQGDPGDDPDRHGRRHPRLLAARAGPRRGRHARV